MAKNKVQWGMIGTGSVTELKSAPSFNKIKNSSLVSVGNRTPEKAADYASRHGIPKWHKDPYDVIRDPEVDIVYIATPPGSHPEYAIETIRAGKPVYIEKPLANTWDDCQLINEAALRAGIPVYVAYYRRSLDYFLKVKEIIDAGSLGQLLSIHMQQHFIAREEDKDPEHLPWRVIPEISGGGYFHDVGCHALDIVFYIFGDPLGAVGQKSNLGGLYPPEDTVTASIRLQGDLLVSGNWSFISPEAFVQDRIYVTGEKGTLEFSVFSFDPITLKLGNEVKNLSPKGPEHIQQPLIQSIVSEMLGEGRCPSTGETAAITSLVMDQILGT
jgi:predicted dehydrogenase